MINRIPDYLKLHIEEADGDRPAIGLPEFTRLSEALHSATGLQLTLEAHADKDQLTFPWTSPQSTLYKASLVPDESRPNEIGTRDRTALAESLGELLNLLTATRQALGEREAELAAAIPIVSVDADGQHLAERLQAVLRGAAQMLRCEAAGLYILDEGTTSLKLRSQYGLGETAFLSPPRRLETSIADVEALAGHAVVIEDTQLMSHWNVPSPCAAAMCVPISSPTTILGTLWFFSESNRDFSPTEQNLAEMTAGRLAGDLERGILLHEIRSRRGVTPETQHGSSTTHQPAFRPAPVIVGWDVAHVSADQPGCGDFCHWHVAKQQVHLALGASHSCHDRHLASVALQANHAAHTGHDVTVKALFRHVNDSLWSSSADGDTASLFHAKLDPSSGSLKYGLVGGVFVYVLRPHGWEPLHGDSRLLGEDNEITVTTSKQMMMPGDILVAMSGPDASRHYERDHQMNQIAEQLLRNTHLPAHDLSRLASQFLRQSYGEEESLAVLVARRNEASGAVD